MLAYMDKRVIGFCGTQGEVVGDCGDLVVGVRVGCPRGRYPVFADMSCLKFLLRHEAGNARRMSYVQWVAQLGVLSIPALAAC